MSPRTSDAILNHFVDQDHNWLARIFPRSIKIEPSNFATNPNFHSFRHIDQLTTLTHFDYEDLEDEEGEEQGEEGEDGGECPLIIRYAYEFKGVRSAKPFLLLSGAAGFLIITPMRYWSRQGDHYSAGETKEILIGNFYYEKKVKDPRESDEIVMKTWRYSTKSGERDFRHKENWNLYLVHRYGVTLRLPDRSQWQLGGLSEKDADQLFAALLKITRGKAIQELDAPDEPDDEDEYDYDENDEDVEDDQSDEEDYKEPWYEVLGVSPNATESEIRAAYREKIKQYHPDRVSGLGEKLRAVAEVESKKLNAAKDEGLARY